jgi:hypothetical protein
VLAVLLIVAAGIGWLLSVKSERVSVGSAGDGVVERGSAALGHAIIEPRIGQISDGKALLPDEPVVSLVVGSVARAYPIRYLLWHQVVDDTVLDRHVAVTYSPLSGNAVVFDQPIVDGAPSAMVDSPSLYHSSLVLADVATRSEWPQLRGVASSGRLKGTALGRLPVTVVPWFDFATAFPTGSVLLPPRDSTFPYSQTPYPGYDQMPVPPHTFTYAVDNRLSPMQRILGVSAAESHVAFTSSDLRTLARYGITALNVAVGAQPAVVVWRGGTRSMLDTNDVSASRDVGSANAYSAVVAGRLLRFAVAGPRMVDIQTGSTWNNLGRAIAGPLTGLALTPLDSSTFFWFAWSDLYPGSVIWKP